MKIYKIAQGSNAQVYHASATNDDFKILNSLRRGCQSDIAQGYGQGPGFFIWTTEQGATNHIESGFVEEKGKYPIFVTLNINLNPQEWDLDYEGNYAIAVKFIVDNLPLINKIPDGEAMVDGKVILTSKLQYSPYKINDKDYSSIGVNYGSRSYGMPVGLETIGTAGIEEGKFAGSIMDSVQKRYPEIVQKFENDIFDDILSKRKTVALKYVGKKPLIPSKIEMWVNHQWVDVTNKNPDIPKDEISKNNSELLESKDSDITQNVSFNLKSFFKSS